MERKFLRPLPGKVLLVDEQDGETVVGGIVVRRNLGCTCMDFAVAATGEGVSEFGSGDHIVLDDPNVGERIRVDGIVYRLVDVDRVMAVVED